MNVRLLMFVIAAGMTLPIGDANAQLLRRNRNRNNCCQNCNCNNNNYQSSSEATSTTTTAEWSEPSGTTVASEVVQTSYAPEAEVSYPTMSAEPFVAEQTYQPSAPLVQAPVYNAPAFPAANGPQFTADQFAPNQMQNFAQSYPGQIGFRPHDVGYIGPGNMRTHLWVEHSGDLGRVGIGYDEVMAMPLDVAQTWHNHFHGTEGPPNQTVSQGAYASPVSYQQNY